MTSTGSPSQLLAPTSRLRLVERAPFGLHSGSEKLGVEFDYRDQWGGQRVGKARIYLPPEAADGRRIPLVHHAGYEIEDSVAAMYLARGAGLVNPTTPGPGEAGPGDNPLVRGPNLDLALLHAARLLPWFDDTRVVLTGGSAGGWTALILGAESFPVACIAQESGPVNTAYNMTYFRLIRELRAPEILATQTTYIIDQIEEAFGADHPEGVWNDHAILSHWEKVTCPVSGSYSTADMLVPIDQVSRRFVRPFDPAKFPPGYHRDPDRFAETVPEAGPRLDEVIPQDRLRFVSVSPSKADRVTMNQEWDGLRFEALEFPAGEDGWNILIIDEGPPEPDAGHVRHAVVVDRTAFFEKWVTGEIALSQLTAAKLGVLMDRLSGTEWISTSFSHLDTPEAERKDVIRGLRTYCSASPSHAEMFLTLYRDLPVERRGLGETPLGWSKESVVGELERLGPDSFRK